jgi:phosphoserine aminotransferase
MLNFYPGPSKIYPQVKDLMQESYQTGILSMNHRSKAFMAVAENTVSQLKDKLQIPKDYHIYFVSSATECWEIIAQSLAANRSLSIYNGEFGKKWAEATANYSLQQNSTLKPILCLTHSETSNGTLLNKESLAYLKTQFPQYLLAVDATSSMGGVHLEWKSADIWFASVQKCFGLPSGLAILICSPQAIEQGLAISENKHYNSFVRLHQNMLKFQTTHTPNILSIWLLGKLLESLEDITIIHQKLVNRANNFYDFLQKHHIKTIQIPAFTYKGFENEVFDNQKVIANLSSTVIALETNLEKIIALKKAAEQENIILGNGYGAWKDTSIRIANFPAITDEEFEILKVFLLKNFS